jgi:hypothetical protein
MAAPGYKALQVELKLDEHARFKSCAARRGLGITEFLRPAILAELARMEREEKPEATAKRAAE